MENTNKNSFLQKIFCTYKKISESNKYFTSIVTMILTLVTVLGIVVAVKSLMPSEEKVSIATNPAEEAFFNGNYNLAIEEYTKLQAETPWPEYNMEIAEIYSIKGDYVKSNELISKVYELRNKTIDTNNREELKEKDEKITNEIVLTSFMNGENKKALEYGELFLKDNPTYKDLANTMFTVYISNNNMEKAKEILAGYSTSDSIKDLIITSRMNVLLGDWETGLKLLKDACDKNEDALAIFEGIKELSLYDKEKLISEVSKLQSKYKNENIYKIWLAEIYSLDKNTVSKAIDIINSMKNDDLNETEIFSTKFIEYTAYKNKEDSKVAISCLDEMINDNKESYIDFYIQSLYDYESGRYKEAFENAKKSILLNRNYSNIYSTLIPNIIIKDSKAEEGKFENITSYLRTALEIDLFNPEVLVNTAKYYQDIVKDSNKALEYYEIASKIDSKNPEIYYNSALIKINNQREDEGIKLLDKSIELDSSNAKYYRTLGSVYLNKGKNEKAINAIRSAYAIDEKDIINLNNAGYYYICVEGDMDRALVNFKAAYNEINENTDSKIKEIITENYNRIKTYKKDNSGGLTISQFKLIEY
ncbi:hypothetical protein DVV91_11595 [Clostridium botulinum]|uniref:tetratricopeptide repeat protein n=1 Tax=Clostridium botulinum TaxID=1491 RepID=UPI001967B834|nr:hypothetical protein [Clostridium botulinum]MBN1049264.1 hypothetical protein [Clostridium botulinum]MBN1074986.1 hypothetical protein [Clostridium botulinum]